MSLDIANLERLADDSVLAELRADFRAGISIIGTDLADIRAEPHRLSFCGFH